jgi:hypothetical protein
MSESAVAQLRQQIQAEYEAAERGLSGLASGTARHDFITTRRHSDYAEKQAFYTADSRFLLTTVVPGASLLMLEVK